MVLFASCGYLKGATPNPPGLSWSPGCKVQPEGPSPGACIWHPRVPQASSVELLGWPWCGRSGRVRRQPAGSVGTTGEFKGSTDASPTQSPQTVPGAAEFLLHP